MMGQRDQDMDFNYLQRVKVYKLNDDGKWDDKGTGHVSVEYLQKSDAMGLVVLDEDDNSSLMIHRISGDDIYQRQEETIISWTDPEIATDLALSFQETVGCSYIWDQICAVQKQIQFPSTGALDVGTRFAEELEHSGTSQDDEDTLQEGGRTDSSDLPPVSMNSLPQIAKVLVDVPPFHRDRLASALLKESGDYIKKLVDLFKLLEDLENVEGLQHMYKIMKGIVLLGHVHVYDVLFSENYLTDVIGALEYDPELPLVQEHRKYLKEQAVFKEVVPIEDLNVRFRIQQTYYLGYLKDVVLPRVLDDMAFSALANVILCNNVEIVQHLQLNRPFILELFSRLQAKSPMDTVWKDMVLFLKEFCGLSKHLQPVHRNDLYSTLIGTGLFDVVTTALQSSDDLLCGSGTDILMSTLNHDPSVLRQFLVEQKNHTLFSLLVKGMLSPSDGGIQVQLLEMMRMLLDSDTMEAAAEKSTFLDVFYEEYIDKLVAALACGCPPRGEQVKPPFGLAGESAPDVLNNICDLLCFCVHHHSFRIKYYVLRNNLVEKVLRLTRRKERYLVVAAVRFLRTCIGLKDDFYYRYLVKNSLFEPVFQAFWLNGNKYNLLNSAVVEMVEFIWKENIKSLIAHIVEKYWLRFENIDYVETFRKLKLKYDQAMDGPPPPSSLADVRPAFLGARAGPTGGGSPGARGCGVQDQLSLAESRRRDERSLDKDEEDYFNADSDDEEDTASAPAVPLGVLSSRQTPPAVIINGVAIGPNLPFRSGGFGLVDYEDEEEESPPSVSGGAGVSNGSSHPSNDRDNFDMAPLAALSPISEPIWMEVGSPPRCSTVGKRLAGDSLELQKCHHVIANDTGSGSGSIASERRKPTESIGGGEEQSGNANHVPKKRRLGFGEEERGDVHAMPGNDERSKDGGVDKREFGDAGANKYTRHVRGLANGVWANKEDVERLDADHGRRCKESNSNHHSPDDDAVEDEVMAEDNTFVTHGICERDKKVMEGAYKFNSVLVDSSGDGRVDDNRCRQHICGNNSNTAPQQGDELPRTNLRSNGNENCNEEEDVIKSSSFSADSGGNEEHADGGDAAHGEGYHPRTGTGTGTGTDDDSLPVTTECLGVNNVGAASGTGTGTGSLGSDVPLPVRGSNIVRAATSSQEPYEVR